MDSLWHSPKVSALVAAHDVGGLIKVGRTQRGWRQADLGARVGCSASTVCRLEQSKRVTDVDLVRAAAAAVGLPAHLLAAACGFITIPAVGRTRVTRDVLRDVEEDSMRRRTLLAVAGLAAPAGLLAGMDSALASMPDPTGSPLPFDQRVAAARASFDAGHNERLLRVLPGLLADGHEGARRTRGDLACARLSAVYSLASQVLVKVGRYDQARLTADRAALYAELSDAPLVAAAAARELGIVLRHQGRPDAARVRMAEAVSRVEATGLKTEAQASAYAQMLCTTSYTAAVSGDRQQALTMIREASRAARALPGEAPVGRLFPLTPASVDIFAVSVHWALGDAGAALEAGRSLRAGQFPTAERRGRMHTDLARAWWQWGKPEQTAAELLSAYRVSPGEIRDRPSIRRIAAEVCARHPRTAGAQELAKVADLRAVTPGS
ncbi:helix-turn-helix domain-containing protein [Streptomyces sp. ITFR-16]|nr:helix-turn-helix domain-containing protein [Streptomyces sp. ITFR-16]WNI26948.1 helix-turn-helix domain-containing protein [Streptomyces sp. ITFR-16]